ncbi:hypothetical protein [Actinophytocola sp.]|uniref:hypothetical protein n=1 Tax=Actinophytocola sp. TaxID=1872138 RepID=UPI002D80145A|nr:hypothetical protein [Actinophytocola sp.]HET9144115.1 hypothetical protein [Actinophytocola sp.]
MTEPDSNDPCRRCEHPRSAHFGEGPNGTGCTVEFGKAGRVPTTALGGVCPCHNFVFAPAAEQPEESEPEQLDGPKMYADGLGYLRLARSSSVPHVVREACDRARTHFAGAQAFVLGRIAIDNGVGDLEERRWLAALAGEDELPEEDTTA